MPLIRIGSQEHREAQPSLEKWFNETSPGMVKVLRGLEKAVGYRKVFCLTSHRDLVLLDQDDHASPWWVVVGPRVGAFAFYVECLMPESLAPWPGARARAEVRTAEEAVQRVLIGMRYSQGWPDLDLAEE